MNARRAAAKLREQAEELLALAAELEREAAPKPARRIAIVEAPRAPTELEQKRADEALRKLGYRV